MNNAPQRNIKRAAVCLAMLIAACTPTPAKNPQPLPLESSPRDFVSAGAEYRSAWQLAPASYTHPIHAANPGATLRIGLRPASSDSPVTLTLKHGGDSVVAERVRDINEWFDLRIPLELGDTQYDLTLECDERFWISHLEITENEDRKPNILLFLVDTLRADRLGCYGYARNTSPNIDALAANAIRFTRAIPQSTWTRPSIASILTSTYPGVHGAEDRPDVLRKGLPSLAATLRENGYTTIGIANNPNLQTTWGFGLDFDRFIDLTTQDELEYNERDLLVVDRAKAAIADVSGRNWMLFVHLMAPHDPYSPPPPFNEKFPPVIDGLDASQRIAEATRSRYDGDIAFADSLFGQVLDDLRERGVLDNTLVIFVSDHGEQFYEHGSIGHGFTLYDEELIVPLILKPPRYKDGPRTVESIVELVDIAPTILSLIGAESNPRFQGQLLLAESNNDDAASRLGFAQLRLGQIDLRTVRSARYKYILDATTNAQSFFDLAADPEEKAPLPEPPPEAAALIEHARFRAAADATGFHFLLIDLDSSNRLIDATVKLSGLDEFDFRNPGGDIQTEREGDTISFRGRMKYPNDDEQVREMWSRWVRLTNFVHIHAEAGIDAQLSITFDHEGTPPSPPSTHGGQNSIAIPLDGTPVPMTELIASPDRYALSTLPEEFAIFAWYVPTVETIQDEDLPPELLDSLEALGYVR